MKKLILVSLVHLSLAVSFILHSEATPLQKNTTLEESVLKPAALDLFTSAAIAAKLALGYIGLRVSEKALDAVADKTWNTLSYFYNKYFGKNTKAKRMKML